MTLQYGTQTDHEPTLSPAQAEKSRRPYATPSIRSGLAFEPVLAATCTNDNEDECAGSDPDECF
ncbi:MAG: hypothetical protein CL940_09510 [Deltaproteobacteria bacterium]|nr:hypothetical protein [Deltaproteobacteria bacterium]